MRALLNRFNEQSDILFVVSLFTFDLIAVLVEIAVELLHELALFSEVADRAIEKSPELFCQALLVFLDGETDIGQDYG